MSNQSNPSEYPSPHVAQPRGVAGGEPSAGTELATSFSQPTQSPGSAGGVSLVDIRVARSPSQLSADAGCVSAASIGTGVRHQPIPSHYEAAGGERSNDRGAAGHPLYKSHDVLFANRTSNPGVNPSTSIAGRGSLRDNSLSAPADSGTLGTAPRVSLSQGAGVPHPQFLGGCSPLFWGGSLQTPGPPPHQSLAGVSGFFPSSGVGAPFFPQQAMHHMAASLLWPWWNTNPQFGGTQNAGPQGQPGITTAGSPLPLSTSSGLPAHTQAPATATVVASSSPALSSRPPDLLSLHPSAEEVDDVLDQADQSGSDSSTRGPSSVLGRSSVGPNDSASQVGSTCRSTSIKESPERAAQSSQELLKALAQVNPEAVTSSVATSTPPPGSSRALLGMMVPGGRDSFALNPSAMFLSVMDGTAKLIRGGKSAPSVPPPGTESFAFPNAFRVGKFLTARPVPIRPDRYRLASGAWNTTPPPITPEDKRVAQNAEVSSTTLSLSYLAEWERIARTGLLINSSTELFLSALVTVLQGGSHRGDPSQASSFQVASEVDSQSVLSLAQTISGNLEASTVMLARLQTNLMLARRDALLKSSVLSQEDRATLRALPPSDASLFGPYISAFMKDKAAVSREDAALRASSQGAHHVSVRTAPPRAPKRRRTPSLPPAKKPKISGQPAQPFRSGGFSRGAQRNPAPSRRVTYQNKFVTRPPTSSTQSNPQ